MCRRNDNEEIGRGREREDRKSPESGGGGDISDSQRKSPNMGKSILA